MFRMMCIAGYNEPLKEEYHEDKLRKDELHKGKLLKDKDGSCEGAT